ncbi:uncharacterized protein LOC142323685 [Lycorma delicatula]|uniref:uncharacterized protein LOC142323685 n=1 Tax=Lycorma delicatula TaxID=130591 RepID=UPI003F517B3C
MAVTCPECKKEFSKASNCKRHYREKHEENSVEKVKKMQCSVCNKSFKRKQHLDGHMISVHCKGEKKQCPKCTFSTALGSNLSRHIKLIHGAEAKPVKYNRQYNCSFCSSSYTYKRTLTAHERLRHGVSKPVSSNRKKICPLCGFLTDPSCNGTKVMYMHFESEHGVSLKWESFQFSNISDFYVWKYEVENSTASKFIGSNKQAHKHCLRFRCHRSGVFKSSVTGKPLKVRVSCKVNGFCPATIATKIGTDGTVKVSFLNVHVGHKNGVKHLFLSNLKSKIITTELAEVHNNERSLNLCGEGVSHPFDPVSIEIWTRDFKASQENPLLFLKLQGTTSEDFPELGNEDFVLLFMTDIQKEILKKYGGDIVCVDKVNTYYFLVYTLLVVDDTGEGVPVAFMFSDTGGENVVKLFFEKIKQYVGQIMPQVFMSDMGDVFHNAWSKVMGESGIRLYYVWHVLKAWRKNIHQRIKLKTDKDEINKILQTILCELNATTFHRMLESTLKKWNENENTKAFATYFLNTYVDKEKYRNWAYCYRIGAGINTNIAIENFNKLLSYCYLRGKKSKRLDVTLFDVLKLLQDKLFDILIKTYERRLVSKLQNLKQRHKESFELDTVNILVQPNGWWQVLSSDSHQFYSVLRIRSLPCKGCSLQCYHCKSCFHQYICSCTDNGIKNNMCKHIHMVARLVRDQENVPMKDNEEAMIIDSLNDDTESSQYTVLNGISKEENDQEVNFEEAKEKFIQDLAQMLRDEICTLEELKSVQGLCKPIKPILDSIKAVTE